MEAVDIILLVLLGIGALNGYRKGLIMEIITIIALILGIFLGLKLLHEGMDFLRDQFDLQGKALPYISFLVIFILVILLTNLTGKVVKETVHMTVLGGLDKLGGAIFGLLKWAFGLSVFIWISNFVFPDFIAMYQDAMVLSKVEPIAPWVISYFTSLVPILDTMFKEEMSILNVFLKIDYV